MILSGCSFFNLVILAHVARGMLWSLGPERPRGWPACPSTMSASAPCACNGRKSLVLSSGSIHRWCDLCERSPVDQAVTGTGWDRDGNNTPPWFVQQEGQWFWKAVHILSRSTKLFTPAILRRGLTMTEYNYSERSTVGRYVFDGREAVDASLI